MPIIVPRNGPIEPKIINPPTPEQVEKFWEIVVKAWCEKHPERLMELMEESHS